MGPGEGEVLPSLVPALPPPPPEPSLEGKSWTRSPQLAAPRPSRNSERLAKTSDRGVE
jgi:hypothetical protein